MGFPYLSIIVFLPLAGAILLALWPRPSARTVRLLSLSFALVAFILSIVVFFLFDRSAGGFQFVQMVDWIPSINAHYFLGVDGLGLTMLLLTTLLGLVAVLVSWGINMRVREYFCWLLVLETCLLGVFSSLDLILFLLFWEFELVPMYLLISIWGTGRKDYSAMKYLIYTILGGAMILAGILLVYFNTGTLDMTQIQLTGTTPIITTMFFLLFLGFAIKLPMFPFHTWLPDAHTDAPTAVSVMLAGVLIKMGGYGMIRLCVSMFPGVAHDYAPILAAFAVVSVLYGAAVTLRQTDLKRLIAYSSISHMGYVLLGIFCLSEMSLTGATLQMFSHGVITGLLFAMVGLVYDKTHHRLIPELGGLARRMPVIAAVFSIAGLAALGLPGTSGFAAEFLVFLGSFSSGAFRFVELYTVLGIIGIVITAGYILWMLQRVFFGPPKAEYEEVEDANRLEMVPIFTLVAVILLIGVYPAILTNVIGLGIAGIV